MWKPLIRLSDEDWIGVAGDPGIWIGGIEGPRSAVNMADPVWLWPLLERSFHSVRQEVEGVWPEISASTGLGRVDEFVHSLAVSALSSGREYWISRALDWVEQMNEDGVRNDKIIDSVIARAAQDGDISQRLSHRLRRILKGIRRRND